MYWMTIACMSQTCLYHITVSSSLVAALLTLQHYPLAPADSEWFIMSSGNSGSGVRCSGDGGCRVSSVVQPGQCPVLPTVGAGVWGCERCHAPSSSLPTGPVWPPPLPSSHSEPELEPGSQLHWPLCPLRWTQIRGPARRKDQQYNDRAE